LARPYSSLMVRAHVRGLQGLISGVMAAIVGIEHCGLISVFSELVDALTFSAAAKRLSRFRLTPHVDRSVFSVTNIDTRRRTVMNVLEHAWKTNCT
jgi:hypothetical protein